MVNKNSIKEMVNQRLTEIRDKKFAAGVLIKCVETERVLLLLRNDKSPVWDLMSGTLEGNEKPLEGLKREIHEEMKIDANIIEFKFVHAEYIMDINIDFYYFKGFTKEEFIPILDHENLAFKWCSKDDLPRPLFKGLDEKIAEI